VTLHAGEEGLTAPDPRPYIEELEQVIALGVDRIGHGILAAEEPRLVEALLERGIVLEVCPTSNIRTGAVRGEEHIAGLVFALQAAGVPLVVATDGPEMIGTRLRAEYGMLVRLGALTREEARDANARAHQVSFIGSAGGGRPATTRAGGNGAA
jgi:adenosine deaminase